MKSIRTINKNIRSIIKSDDISLQINEINDDFIDLDVLINFDLVDLMTNNITKAKISLEKIDSDFKNKFNPSTPEGAYNILKRSTIESKKSAIKRKENKIKNYSIDLTSAVPNDFARFSSMSREQAASYLTSPSNKVRTFGYVTKKKMVSKTFKETDDAVSKVNTSFTVSKGIQKKDIPQQSIALDSLFINKTPVSSIKQGSNTANYQIDALSGVSKIASSKGKIYENSYTSVENTNLETYGDVIRSKGRSQLKLVEFKKDYSKTFKKNIKIYKNDIDFVKSELYLNFSIVNASDITLKSIKKILPITQVTDSYSVLKRQKKEYQLWSRRILISERLEDEIWALEEKIKDYESTKSKIIKATSNLYNDDNPKIYRIVEKNTGKFEEFTSFSFLKGMATSPYLWKNLKEATGRTELSLTATNSEAGIALEVRSRIFDGSVAIIRRNLTLKEKNWSVIEIKNDISMPAIIKKNTYKNFLDLNVKNGHTYEYALRTYDRRGRVEDKYSFVIQRDFDKFGEDVGTLVVTKPTISVDADGQLNCYFVVKNDLIQQSLDVTTKLLDQELRVDFFEDAIVENREQFSNLYAFHIERVDLTTGEKVDFGIKTTAQFSDKDASRKAGVKGLQPDREYQYIISLLSRSTETLIEKFTRSVTDINKKSYTLTPYRFLGPDQLSRGTLNPTDFVPGSDIERDFLKGRTGKKVYTRISTNVKFPSIISARSNLINVDEKLVQLNWKTSGRVEDIDHFEIIMNYDGINQLVDKIHCNNGKSSHKTFFKLSKKIVGTINYTIVPIMINYEKGSLFKTNDLVIN
ncbi:MAG: hypothetical protein ACW98X_22600 [Promethearchaeota archaeon]|jgi:hypothetical protein